MSVVLGPIVLAGHSAGGLHVREYARQFPADVAGVALLDASFPGQIDALPGWRAAYERNQQAYPGKLRWEKMRVWSGWERLMGRCRIEASGENPDVAAQYGALLCRPAFVGGEDSEFMYFDQSCNQAGRLTTFGPIPLLIIPVTPSCQAKRDLPRNPRKAAFGTKSRTR